MANNCEDKIKYSCSSIVFANCVKTEVEPPVFSSLTNNCNTVQEVEEDVYNLIDEIKQELNLTSIVTTCGTLPTIKNIKTLIEYLIIKNCEQQIQIDNLITQNTTQATQIAVLQATPCP
jgi:hypothetical protein